MGKKIGSIDPKMKKKFKTKKFKKKHPLSYIDKKGEAFAVPVKRHKGGKVKKGRVPKRKHVKLGGTKVADKYLKMRKQHKKIFYITKSGSIMMTKSGLKSKKRRKSAKKGAKRSRKKSTKLTKKQRRSRAGKRAWKTRVRKYGKSGCKRGRRKTKPRRCKRKPGRKTAARRRRRRR